MTVTWPRYPAVPLSTRGMSAAKHILFTWLRAAVETESMSFCSSFECAGICVERVSSGWSHVNTSVIQCIHHQCKLSKELHVVVRAEWRNMGTQPLPIEKKDKYQRSQLCFFLLAIQEHKSGKKQLTSWCCHGRQWYLQWDKTVRRSP